MLAKSEEKILETYKPKLEKETHISYPAMGAYAFPSLNFKINSVNFNIFSICILVGIIFTSIGVSSIYMIFISSVISDLLFNRFQILISDKVVLTISFPLILFLIFLSDYKMLAKLSLVGNLSVLSGCFAVLIYGFITPNINSSEISTFNKNTIVNIPAFFANTSFLFAIHVVMLPILQKMKTKSHIKGVITVSYSIISLFNFIFAAIASYLYAKSVCNYNNREISGPCENILNNIPNGNLLLSIKVFICIDLLFTIPLVFSAAKELLESSILSYILINYGNSVSKFYVSSTIYLARILLSLIPFFLAIIVPNLSQMVNLVGGVVCSFTGYIIPPILYLKFFWGELSISQKNLCCIVLCFGNILLFFILSTYIYYA
jgi:hypothetical protein